MKGYSASRARQLFYWQILLAGTLLLATFLVVSNNSIRTAPIFMTILVLGVGLMLGLGLVWGGLANIVLIAAWFGAKQAIGVWHEAHFAFNLLEIALGMAAFALAGLLHDRMRELVSFLTESESKLQQLDLEDVSVGLLKRSIGLVRLEEEQERALRFRRPLSLVLVNVEPCAGSWQGMDPAAAMRSAASAVKDTTRRADIPFLVQQATIGVILPETGPAGAIKVVDHIRQKLPSARIIKANGSTERLSDWVRFSIGVASFLGEAEHAPGMLEAAERSLQMTRASGQVPVSAESTQIQILGMFPESRTPPAATDASPRPDLVSGG